MGNPNPGSGKLPPIPDFHVPMPRAPNELDFPDELAWQRYRIVAPPKKHVVRLSPKQITLIADRRISGDNPLIAGILYMVAGLLYAGSPFRSTKERQYLTDTIDQLKAVELLSQALDAFTLAKADSYCLLVQECIGVPLMHIPPDKMNDTAFSWLQEIIQPLSIPVYNACLAFKRGAYFLNTQSNQKKALEHFQDFLNLAKTSPDSSPLLPEQQRRLDVDRSQETVRHADIASDFIFDYARAVKQFIHPKYFVWWLYLASRVLIHYHLETRRKSPPNELTRYIRNIRILIETLDNCITQKPDHRSHSGTPEHIQRLHEKLFLEFHLEASTALADSGNTLFLCKLTKESQSMFEKSLNILKRGYEYALELEQSEWLVRFRIAQSILLIRLGKLQDAADLLSIKLKSVRKHPAIEHMKKLVSELIKSGKSKRSTRKHAINSISKTLVSQPLDWPKYNWSIFLEG